MIRVLMENRDIYINHTKTSIKILTKAIIRQEIICGVTIITRNDILLRTLEEFTNDKRIQEYERRYVETDDVRVAEVFIDGNLERKEVINVFFEILKRNLKEIEPED